MLRISALFATLSGACAHAAALFCLVEGCLCSGTRPLPPCSVCVLLRHLPSSALLWGAGTQALALFLLVLGFLCSGAALLPLVVGSLCPGTCPLPPC